ncbi:hypothetical protein [Marinobacter fonticola]|uniref:hypothetical protein n=1 Tax=Marinobacter fonticola TaxID=2603215 RepID=UPI0011E79515|nr:hypothetical protein [Marinobacter fonticola]
MYKKSLLIALALLIGASPCFADGRAAKQSFETCSMITSEYITVLQLVHQGFTGEQLLNALPGLSEGGATRVRELAKVADQDGLVDTFSSVNAEYARCSKQVFEQTGAPDPATREGHFYFCAGENKLRHEILLAATLEASKNEVLTQIPASRHRMARAIFELQDNQGTLAAFDAIGDELKYCLNGQS